MSKPKTWLEKLKCGDEVAVALKGQETVWRKASVKHGVQHGSIVVEMAGREIEFGLNGICLGDPETGLAKVLLQITQEMLTETRRVELLQALSAFDFETFTNQELEAIFATLSATAAAREPKEDVDAEAQG